MTEFRIGTSAFTADGWVGSFYPAGMKPRDFLTYYSTKFSTVEIDPTFYRMPSRSTVTGWADRTPEGFLIATKVPQTITHEKCLEYTEDDIADFVFTMELLGDDKLGPMLFQFPYFNKKAFKSEDKFLGRLKPFLKKLPKGYHFAVEIRNKNWLNWVDVCQRAVRRGVSTYVYVNNHYSGYAPATAEQFLKLWKANRK